MPVYIQLIFHVPPHHAGTHLAATHLGSKNQQHKMTTATPSHISNPSAMKNDSNNGGGTRLPAHTQHTNIDHPTIDIFPQSLSTQRTLAC